MSSFLFSLILVAASGAQAGSATWALNPADNNWTNASNWTPNTVPDSPTDVATFDVSNTTAVSINDTIELDGMIFTASASPYTLILSDDEAVTLSGATGILNNSTYTQEITVESGSYLQKSGSVSALVHFDIFGGNSTHTSGEVTFGNGSSPGGANFDVDGADGSFPAGQLIIRGGSASGTIVLHRGLNRGPGGSLDFEGGSAGSANITCEGGDFKAVNAGNVVFTRASTADDSTILVEGSHTQGATQAVVSFESNSTAASATLTADGTFHPGGSIRFSDQSTGGACRVVLNGTGSLDISGLFPTSGVTIGSLEGQTGSVVLLGAKELSVGSNNSSTSYRGRIKDGGLGRGSGGSLVKIGSGILTLIGQNTYTGGTTVSEGSLIVASQNGSTTGTGAVQVNAGTIGGAGIIAGSLTVGSGSGPGASLVPAFHSSKQVTTHVGDFLLFNSDGNYIVSVDPSRVAADSVVANGVTIDPSAHFNLRSQKGGSLAAGTTFIAIENTAATPITGSFSDLPEGATITEGRNTYSVSYQGGDGNDMTLTVVR